MSRAPAACRCLLPLAARVRSLAVVSLAVISIGASVAQAAGPAPKSPCVLSDTYAVARSDQGLVDKDLDGDGRPDLLRVIEGGGSGSSSTQLELSLSSTDAPLTISMDFDFGSFLAFAAVPPSLLGKKQSGLRELVGRALFPLVCEGPDPSLDWLLERTHPLRWHPGRPTMPALYGFLTTRSDLLQRARTWLSSDGEPPAPLPKAAWVLYAGHNHGRTREGPELSGEFKVLAQRKGQELWGTAHGVVLVELAPARFAWLFVHTGAEKLRWPTVFGAKFDGNVAVIDHRPALAEERSTLRVDLKTGQIRERSCSTDLWDEKTQECPAE